MTRHVPSPGHKGVYTSVYPDRTVYEVRYRDSDGRERWKVTGPTLKTALDFQATVRVKLNQGERFAPTTAKFQQVAEEWRQSLTSKKLAEATLKSYNSCLDQHVLPRFGNRKIQDITVDEIANWIPKIRRIDGKEMGEGTRAGVYGVMRDVMTYATNPRRGYLSVNPCAHLERNERPAPTQIDVRVLEEGEANRLLDACPEWLQQIVKVSLLSGLRKGEILGLRWQDVSFKTDEITVAQQLLATRTFGLPKGNKTRTIPLLPPLRPILFEMQRFGGGLVFVNQNGQPYLHQKVSAAFKTAREKAGLSESPRAFRFHDCRHTFASALLRDGKDVTWVAQMLGHSNPTITMKVYSHVMGRENRNDEATGRLKDALGEWVG